MMFKGGQHRFISCLDIFPTGSPQIQLFIKGGLMSDPTLIARGEIEVFRLPKIAFHHG
jgi:hypothetical protein